LPVSDAKLGFEYKLKRWLDGSLLPPDEAHLYWNGGFSERERRRLAPTLAQAAIEHLYSGLPDSSEVGFLNRYLLFDQRYYLQDNLLAKVDRMSMAHSLEVRPPFLDHRIVEFAFRLPEALKIRGREQKIVLKDAMRGKLPDSILRRPKSGLDIPAHNWFRGPLLPLLMDTLSPERLRALPVIDAAEVQRLIADHQARRINAGFQLWGLLTLFLWLRTWDVAYDAEVRLIAGTDTVSVAAV
jgi:asparagine synthase (glutamine-hydrolysing)